MIKSTDQTGDKVSILLIEDNFDLRENLREILTLHGYNIFTAENGEMGVEMAAAESYDLILCDVGMPGISGFDVLKCVKSDGPNSSVPFIFITGSSDSASRCKGLDIGADDYLFKPFHDQELISAIKCRLRKHKQCSVGQTTHVEQLEKIINFVSHDLRAPLSTCLGLAQMLEKQVKMTPRDGRFNEIMSAIIYTTTQLDESTRELTRIVYNSILRCHNPNNPIHP